MSKMSIQARQRLSEQRLGSKNPMWRGDEAGYDALHKWVRQRLPQPEFCERCFHEPSYDLANVTGVYKRDLTNWRYLCRKCHMLVDGRMVARDKNGKFMSIKRVRIYSPLRSKSQLKIYPYPNFAASTTKETS